VIQDLQLNRGLAASARSVYLQAAALAPTLTKAQHDGEWDYLFGFVYGSQAVSLKRQGRRRDACELFARSAAYYKDFGPSSTQREDDRVIRIAEVQKELANCGR
jgi:hypothetical protein